MIHCKACGQYENVVVGKEIQVPCSCPLREINGGSVPDLDVVSDIHARKVEPKFSKAERLFLDNANAIKALKEVVIALEQRIDRIVAGNVKIGVL